MGLPVLLSVLTEDRDDLELLKGALEVLHLSVALPEGADSKQLEQQGVCVPGFACLHNDSHHSMDIAQAFVTLHTCHTVTVTSLQSLSCCPAPTRSN